MSDFLKENLEIIIITCNRELYLKKTLKQLLNSPLKNCNITILDNASNDGTKKLIEIYCLKNKNIRTLRHNLNIGGNSNIVRAFEYSSDKKYKWVICDDDVLNITDFGIKQLEKAIKNNIGIILVANYLLPKNYTLEQLFKQFCFLPSTIFRNDLIDNDILQCMYDNVGNMLPHLIFYIVCYNNMKSIKVLDHNFVNRGMNFDSPTEYMRTRSYAHPYRKDMSWIVGFFNSLQILNNKKILQRIMNDYLIYVGGKNIFSGIVFELNLNRNYYNNCFKNISDLFVCFDNCKRFLLILALFLFPIFKYFNIKNTPEGFCEYFKKNKLNLKSIFNRYKNKTIIIYGAGKYFEGLLLFDKQNIIRKNVKVIVDSKFPLDTETNYNGFIGINPKDVEKYKPDIILVSVYQFKMIKNLLESNGINTKIVHLIKQGWLDKMFNTRV